MEPVCRGHFAVAALLAAAVATTGVTPTAVAVVTATTTAIGRAKQSTKLAAP